MRERTPFHWIKAISEGRFLFLLVFLLLFIGITPLLYRIIPFMLVYDLSFTAVLIAGIYAASERRRDWILATLFAVPMLGLIWTAYWWETALIRSMAKIFGILFVGYTIGLMLAFILRTRQISLHTVCAAVSTYLLLGVLWSFVYGILSGFDQQAFSTDLSTPYSLLYFSFVTLTTLGFGDILPLTPEARALTILEAVVGQLYLAVIVARLVGIYISQKEENAGNLNPKE